MQRRSSNRGGRGSTSQRIITGTSSAGVPVYSDPSDTDYADYIQQAERNNAQQIISQAIIPVPEIVLSEEQLLEQAISARLNSNREDLIVKALRILYSQGDEITLGVPEITSLNLSHDERGQLLQRYIAQPTSLTQLSKQSSIS